MNRSQFIETLKTFDITEMKDFELFIRSPFFNTNQSVQKLFEQIKKLYPSFEKKDLEKKLLFEKAFGRIKYNDSFLRMTIFRLQELAKEFLIFKNLQKNPLLKETLLLDERNSRELNSLLEKSIIQLDKKIDKLKVMNADSYLAKYRLEYFRNDLKSRNTRMITYKDTLDEELMLEQKNLNTFFFISSLKFYQYFLNQKNFVINAEGYPDFMNNIIQYLKSNPEYLKAPVLMVYYYLVLLITTNDDKYFFELQKILFEDRDDIGYIEKYNIIAVLRNYGHKKHNKGDLKFIDINFDILKFAIRKDILTIVPGGKYISETRFMNIVWSGLSVKEFDWVEDFIKKYIVRIEPAQRQYVLAYNSARLEFEKGNYDKAIEMLGSSGPVRNIYYKAAFKHLTIMIYYELKWFIPAAELLDAYKHFIKSDKLLPEIYKEQSNTFINYFHRLLKLRDNDGNKSFEMSGLSSELESSAQGWLLKKVKELEAKGK